MVSVSDHSGYQLHLLLAGMDWPAWITAISTAIIALGTGVLAAGVVVALVSLRDARKTRHGSLLADLSRRWDEPVIVESQRLFARYTITGIVELVQKLYGTGGATDHERSDFTVLEAVPNFCELLGVLHQEAAVSTPVIDRMWGDAIRNAWRDWKEPVAKLRELTQIPGSYSNFEDLDTAIREWRLKNG